MLTTGSFLTSGMFAVNTFGDAAMMDSIPDDVISMALTPILISSLSILLETYVGLSKGVMTRSILLPTFTLGTYGQRSTYTTPFKNRNDIFDTAAVGILASLALSFALIYIGFSASANDAAEVVNTYPTGLL